MVDLFEDYFRCVSLEDKRITTFNQDPYTLRIEDKDSTKYRVVECSDPSKGKYIRIISMGRDTFHLDTPVKFPRFYYDEVECRDRNPYVTKFWFYKDGKHIATLAFSLSPYTGY